MRGKNKKAGRHHSAISRQVLHGVHGKGIARIGKLSKTQKRPSVMFAGALTGRERAMVFEEAAKVLIGSKKIQETGIRLRGFIEQAIKRSVR